MKLAICQVADTGPLESLVVMLRAAGYEVAIPEHQLLRHLKSLKCDTVTSVEQLVQSMGYERPLPLRVATVRDMARADLYVDVKGHRNGPKIWKVYPHLRNRTLWFRVNGGELEPERCEPAERDLPCPVLTPNRHYLSPGPWGDRAYVAWIPFYRFSDYSRAAAPSGPPVCLIHRAEKWGFGDIMPRVRNLGVKVYGVDSPDGLLNHVQVPSTLSNALAMVHLKSNDCPGYALYEALASACPLVVSRCLIWRMKMEDLFVPGVTCLAFDYTQHTERTEEQASMCVSEIGGALSQLADYHTNRRIGEAGRRRLQELMWSPQKEADVESFRDFMKRNFG